MLFSIFEKKTHDGKTKCIPSSLFKSLERTKLHVKRHFVETESDKVLLEKCAHMDIKYDLEGNSS